MWGIPEHEEWRRFRAAWYRWGQHDGLRQRADLAWCKRRAGADATKRAGRRVQIPTPYALRDISHKRWGGNSTPQRQWRRPEL